MAKILLDENGKPIKSSTGVAAAQNLEPGNIKNGACKRCRII